MTSKRDAVNLRRLGIEKLEERALLTATPLDSFTQEPWLPATVEERQLAEKVGDDLAVLFADWRAFQNTSIVESGDNFWQTSRSQRLSHAIRAMGDDVAVTIETEIGSTSLIDTALSQLGLHEFVRAAKRCRGLAST